MLKQLVAGAYGVWNFVPTAPMAVGETTTVTADIPLRLPGASARAPYQTRTTTTLRAIEHRGASRIARLEQRTEPAAPSDQLQVNGSGTIDIDVVRGIVTASAIEWRLAGPLAGIGVENTPGAHGTTPVVATIKVTLASE
jgi:hypothetical protein